MLRSPILFVCCLTCGPDRTVAAPPSIPAATLKVPTFCRERSESLSLTPRLSVHFSLTPRFSGVTDDQEHINCFNSFRNRYETVETVQLFSAAAVTPLKRGVNETTVNKAEGPRHIRSEVSSNSPYSPSPLIKSITWHWETLKTAAPGSDLWPVTWAADDNLYAAWGDGGGFGGTDSDGRVAAGFARIEGRPEDFRGINVNGGKNAEHPASFPRAGKTGGMLAVGDQLYAWVNLQNGKWPEVDEALIWSQDRGATWERSSWVFPKGGGRLKPATFLNCGKGYTGAPRAIRGYVYCYGQKQGGDHEFYLGRAPTDKLLDRSSYQFFSSLPNERPRWSSDIAKAQPIFQDQKAMGDLATVVFVPGLKRYLLTAFHKGPGELGIFDAPQPWGPWTTVAYYEHWGEMGREGHGLNCSFPAKWMSADGLNLWCIFAVYGDGAKQGINAHDKFNLVRASLSLRTD